MRARISLLACSLLLLGAFLPVGAATADPSSPSSGGRGGKGLPALVPSDSGRLARAHAQGRLSAAKYSLLRAQNLMSPEDVGPASRSAAVPRRDATMLLRDLNLRLGRLSAADRQDAARLLARPTDGTGDVSGYGYRTDASDFHCLTDVCVHWVSTTSDAPSAADGDGDGVPNQVDTTAETFQHVWDAIVDDYGYRAPKSDLGSRNHGPDGRLDVYLADLGADELYGYCTSDDPARQLRWDVSAYCVVDDDFAAEQYGGADPLTSLQVTAAHEFFHAVQFGYDMGEDLWLMEGSAAWVEDEVYDDVNDNFQYFPASPLVLPRSPLDFPGAGPDGPDGRMYGSWVFWRFLTEYFASTGHRDSAGHGDRTVLLDVWRRADARPGARDDFSLQAVRAVTARRGVPFGAVFADFGAVNRVAKRWYDEGRRYPQAPVGKAFTLSRSRLGTGWWSARMDHLTNEHVTFRPGSTLTGPRRLRVTLDLPNAGRGSRASVMVQRRDGRVRWFQVGLDRSGAARTTVAFSRRTVSYVALTLTNASTRFRCGAGTALACAGEPLDDATKYSFRARVIR